MRSAGIVDTMLLVSCSGGDVVNNRTKKEIHLPIISCNM